MAYQGPSLLSLDWGWEPYMNPNLILYLFFGKFLDYDPIVSVKTNV